MGGGGGYFWGCHKTISVFRGFTRKADKNPADEESPKEIPSRSTSGP